MAACASLPPLSSIDISFDDADDDNANVDATQFMECTLVMDRRELAIPAPVPAPSPDQTQPARRIVVAERSRTRRVILIAIAFSFVAGLAAAFGTQFLFAPATARAATPRVPRAMVMEGPRRLEGDAAVQKKASPTAPAKKKAAKKKAAPAPSGEPTATSITEEAAEAPADVDPNGLLSDALNGS
jgi:hypothetical protein